MKFKNLVLGTTLLGICCGAGATALPQEQAIKNSLTALKQKGEPDCVVSGELGLRQNSTSTPTNYYHATWTNECEFTTDTQNLNQLCNDAKARADETLPVTFSGKFGDQTTVISGDWKLNFPVTVTKDTICDVNFTANINDFLAKSVASKFPSSVSNNRSATVSVKR